MNPNSGKVYHTLINKINNDLIKMIQKYNNDRSYILFLDHLKSSTFYLKKDIHNYDNNCDNLKIAKSTFGWHLRFIDQQC